MDLQISPSKIVGPFSALQTILIFSPCTLWVFFYSLLGILMRYGLFQGKISTYTNTPLLDSNTINEQILTTSVIIV